MRRPVPKTTAASPASPVATRTLNDDPALASTPVSNIPTHLLPAEQKASSRPLSTPTRFRSSDPDILALQKQQRAIQSRIVSLRTDLDAATQALQLESSTKDTELEALIVKWRRISQDAADEAFVGAQERVNKMGGMKAWQERSKRDATRWEEDEEKREIEHVDEEEEEYRDLGGLSEMLQSRKIVHEQGREESSDEVCIWLLLCFEAGWTIADVL
jgi:Swi5-dependent recombination DNA repair protein 1